MRPRPRHYIFKTETRPRRWTLKTETFDFSKLWRPRRSTFKIETRRSKKRLETVSRLRRSRPRLHPCYVATKSNCDVSSWCVQWAAVQTVWCFCGLCWNLVVLNSNAVMANPCVKSGNTAKCFFWCQSLCCDRTSVQYTFLPRCIHAGRSFLRQKCLSVCLSICPSHTWIVTKRTKVPPRFLYRVKDKFM